MEFDIGKFEEYREDNRLEVKEAKGGLPRSLWETYSSMANGYGGLILLGVSEKKDGSFETTGLGAKDVEKLRRDLWSVLNDGKKVSANLLVEEDVKDCKVGEDLVLSIRVPRAKREVRPVYINDDLFDGTFRRNGEGDYHCSRSEVKAMLRDQTEETSDMKALENVEIGDLNLDTVHAYRNRHSAYRTGHVWESLDDEEYLERIGAAKRAKADKRLHPTAAGLLMFGEEFRILDEYPEYFLDYRETLDPAIRWTDRLQSSSGDWTGNLFDFFFLVYSKLVKDLKRPFKLEGVTRVDDTPVHKALREALANCLVNTDFFVARGVVVKKGSDAIVMENPGCIRTGREQMLKGGISDPRNKALMKMFNMIGIGERAGSGVPDIYAVWESQGWKEPVVEERYGPDRTILTLAFTPKQAEKTSGKNKRKKQAEETEANGGRGKSAKTLENRVKITAFLASEESAGTGEIARHIGLSPARVRVLLSELMDEGMVQATGNGRSRRYSVKQATGSDEASKRPA